MAWGNVSTLGFGLGIAMGAKLAYPDRQIISVTGDAGVSYQMGDYEALIRHCMVLQQSISTMGILSYGHGFWGQGHTPYACEVTPSKVYNTARMAEALGMHAVRIEEPDEVAPAIKEAMSVNKSGHPAFIELSVAGTQCMVAG